MVVYTWNPSTWEFEWGRKTLSLNTTWAIKWDTLLKGGRGEGRREFQNFGCFLYYKEHVPAGSSLRLYLCHRNPVQSEQVAAVEEQGAWLQQASCLLSFWGSQGVTRRHSQSGHSSLPVSSFGRWEEVACAYNCQNASGQGRGNSPPILESVRWVSFCVIWNLPEMKTESSTRRPLSVLVCGLFRR